MDRRAFIKAIADNPDDHTTRLVFADWLDEHGAAGEAAAYRASCEPTVLIGTGEDGWELAIAAQPTDEEEPELLGVYPMRDAAFTAFLRWHQDGRGAMCPQCRGTGTTSEGEADPKGFPVDRECEACGGAAWLGVCDEPGCRELGFPGYPEGSDAPAGQFCRRHRIKHGYCSACGHWIDRLTAFDYEGMCEDCHGRSGQPGWADDEETEDEFDT